MIEEGVGQTPAVFSSKERAALVARALSEAARRARFSTKRRRSLTAGNLRARRSARILKLLKIASFVLIVAIPGVVYSLYMSFIASPQYLAEARFTVRGGMPAGLEGIGNMTGAPSVLIMQDTQVILNFIESRAMVEALQKKIDFRQFYDSPYIDYFSRLKADASIEDAVKYWKHHVKLKVQMPSGIVEFYVKAFTPEDSVKLTTAALEESEQLVNRMNDQMREDAVSLAEAERRRSEASLAKARAALEKARNSEGILSTDVASTAVEGLLADVQGQLLKLQQEYDSQRRYVRADAPQLRNMQTKIDAAKKEIAALKAQMTSTKAAPSASTTAGSDQNPGEVGTGKILSGSMSRLDYATLENQIHEKLYAGALAGLEHAKLASETKLMYINTFVKPVAPEDSQYPNRPLSIAIFLAIVLAIWGAVITALTLAKGSLA